MAESLYEGFRLGEDDEDQTIPERERRLLGEVKRAVAARQQGQQVPTAFRQEVEDVQRQRGQRPQGDQSLADDVAGAAEEAVGAVADALGISEQPALTRDFVREGAEGSAGGLQEASARQASTAVDRDFTPERPPQITGRQPPELPLPKHLARQKRMAQMMDENGEPMFPDVREKWFNRDPEEIREASMAEAERRAQKYGFGQEKTLNPITIGQSALDEATSAFASMSTEEQRRQASEGLEFFADIIGSDELRQRAKALREDAEAIQRRSDVGGIEDVIQSFLDNEPIEGLNDLTDFAARTIGDFGGLMWAGKEEAAAGALAGAPFGGPAGSSIGAGIGFVSGIALAEKNRLDTELEQIAEENEGGVLGAMNNPLVRETVSGLTAAGIGLLEIMMEGRLGREVVESLGRSVADRTMRQMMGSRALRSGRTEAGEETGQLLAEEVSKAFAGYRPNPEELGLHTVNSIAAGAIGGGAAGAGSVVPQEAVRSMNNFLERVVDSDRPTSTFRTPLMDTMEPGEVLNKLRQFSDTHLIQLFSEAAARGDTEVQEAAQAEFNRRREAQEERPGPDPDEPASVATEAATEGQTEEVRGELTPEDARTELEVGDVVGKKRLVNITSNGTMQWQAIDDISEEEGSTDRAYRAGQRVKGPNNQQIVERVARRRQGPPKPELPEARMEAAEMMAAELGISPDSQEFRELVMNTRNIRLDMQDRAGDDWREARQSSIDKKAYEREKRQHLAIATSPENFNQTTRQTAAARAMAMQDAQERMAAREEGRVTGIDIERAAREIAKLDQKDFDRIQRMLRVRQAQGPITDRLRVRANQIRNDPAAQENVGRDHQRVRNLVAQGNIRSSRGATQGTRVRTEDGELGTVEGEPQFGYAEVRFDDGTREVDLREMNVVPHQGDYVTTVSGDVRQVGSFRRNTGQFAAREEADAVQAERPNGESVQIPVSEIDRISDNPESRAELQDRFEAEQERARMQDMVELEQPQSAVLKANGERVDVHAVSDQNATIVDEQGGARVVSRNDLDIGSQQVSERNIGAAVSTFEPGTTPDQENAHINFMVMPQAEAEVFKRQVTAAVEDGDRDAALAAARTLGQASDGGRIYLVPQQVNADQELIAVEIPAQARELTDASKRLLGVLSGNESLDAIGPQTLSARVKLSELPTDPATVAENADDPVFFRVMEVPPGLAHMVESPFNLREMEESEVRDYLSRLTDLNFRVNPEAAEAAAEAQEIVEEKDRARQRGEHAKADRLVIEAQDKAAEANQKQLEEGHREIRRIWNRVTERMREEGEMDGVRLIDGLQEGEREAIRQALNELPGRRGREIGNRVVFDHPNVPGFRMIIDKQTVYTLEESGEPMTEAEIERALKEMAASGILEETYGIDPVTRIELESGDIVERSLADQLTTEQYEELARGSAEIAGTRDIYNVEFRSPSGRQILDRRVGADATIEVPASYEEQTRTIIEEEVRNGRDPKQRLDEEIGDPGDVDVYRLPDHEGAWELIEGIPPRLGEGRTGGGGGQTVTMRSVRTGKEIDVQRSILVNAQKQAMEEPRMNISFPRRLSNEEVLDEVMKKIDQMDLRTKWYSVGEFRHNVDPGVYGNIHQTSDGAWRARVYEEPREPSRVQDKRSTMTRQGEFDSREEAAQWLEDQGMSRGETETSAAEQFQGLPDVESIPGEKMAAVERQLRGILKLFLSGWDGYIPQPVRDYATSFAVRWHQMGLPEQMMDGKRGIFGDWRIRRVLNIFNEKDLRHAAENVDSEVIPTSERVVDGITLTGDRGSGLRPDAVQEAREIYKKWEHQYRLLGTEVPIDMMPVSERGMSPKDLTNRHNLVRFGEEERLGAKIRSLGEGRSVVQYIENGEFQTQEVSNEQIDPVYSDDLRNQYMRAVKEAQGELLDTPGTREMGRGQLDKQFGLDGVTDPDTFEQEFMNHAVRFFNRIPIDEDRAEINATEEQIERAIDIFIRARELGLDTQEFFEGDQAILGPLVEREALDKLQARYSNSSPLGKTLARAKLDMLTNRQKESIADQKRWLNLPQDTPDWKVVERLAENAWEPQYANVLWNLRNDAGFMRLTDEMELPDDVLVELRAPTSGAPSPHALGSYATFPRTMGEKHPAVDLFRRLAEDSRTRHGNRTREGRALIKALSHGVFMEEDFDLEKREFVWDLLQHPALAEATDENGEPILDQTSTPTVEQIREHVFESEETEYTISEEETDVAVASGPLKVDDNTVAMPEEPDWDWETPYFQMREFIVEANRQEVRDMLLQGYRPEYIDPPDAEDGNFVDMWNDIKTRWNLDEQEARSVRERLERGEQVPILRPVTNMREGKNPTEVEMFLDLRERFGKVDDIPADVRENMSDWMVDEFDFWKKWGIKNYAPRIIQGRFAIKNADTGEVMGLASSGADAQRMIQREVNRLENWDPEGNYEIELKGIRDDDITPQILGSGEMSRFYAKIIDMFEKDMGAGSASWTNAMTEALNISEIRPARNPHTRRRAADLSDTLEDPLQRLMVYWGRVSRHSHLVDITRAYNLAERLDPKLSKAFGTSRAFENLTFRNYIDNLRDSYMGRENDIERKFNDVMRTMGSMMSNPAIAPKMLAKKMRQGADYDMWTDPEFLDEVYNENYAGREFTELSIASQSIIRLGWNIGGAAANLTQLPMYVPSELMLRGASMSEVRRYMNQAMNDMGHYYFHSSSVERRELPAEVETTMEGPMKAGTDRAQEISAFVHDIGIQMMPAKGTQGGGLGILDDMAKPMNFSTTGFMDGVKSRAHYAMMKPFSGAENINRIGTALAAKKMAEERGMDYKQQVAFAQEVIDNTQFQYYDQALPPFMRGNPARIIFQFQPFVANALKFQKDLIKAVFTGDLRGTNTIRGPDGTRIDARQQAMKALALHVLIGGLFGGSAWAGGTLATSAFGSALGYLWQALGGTGQGPFELAQAWAGREAYIEAPGPEVHNTDFFRARSLLTGGLPGFFANVSLGGRLAVGGQDLNFQNPGVGDVLGPTAGWIHNLQGSFFNYMSEQAAPRGRASLGALIGGALGSRIGGFPTALSTGLVGMVLATEGSDSPFRDWMTETSAGAQHFSEIAPAWLDAMQFHFDLVNGQKAIGPAGQLMEYPPGPNQKFEIAAAYANLQPSARVGERAYLNWLFRKFQRRRRTRDSHLDRIVQAMSRNDWGQVDELTEDAINRDLGIEQRDIDRAWRRSELGPVERIMRRMPSLQKIGVEETAQSQFGEVF